MELQGVSIVCPACHGELLRRGNPASGTLECLDCGKAYPVILGIPDLRLIPDPYVDAEQDHAKGQLLAELYGEMDFQQAVALYYELTDRVPPFQAQRFAASLARSLPRSDSVLRTWEIESRAGPSGQSLLDVGCGTGPLLQAAAGRYARVTGVDIAFRWLVMARKRLSEAGIDAPLVCAAAEALPFPSGAFDRVVSDSTIEHVSNQPRVVAECTRVLAENGWLFMATPNRFSLGPDPHTGLPAGGWLPDRLTATYVRVKGGIPPLRRLLSESSLRRLIEGAGLEELRVFVPRVPDVQRASLDQPLRAAIDAYHLARRTPFGVLLRRIGPLLHAVAHKAPSSTGADGTRAKSGVGAASSA